MTMKFGLLMPHFGPHAGRSAVMDGAVLAESLGFDSIWVRDHLVFEPHGEMEAANITFYEALTTLTAMGAVTKNIELGTGSLIPFRHPSTLRSAWPPCVAWLGIGPSSASVPAL